MSFRFNPLTGRLDIYEPKQAQVPVPKLIAVFDTDVSTTVGDLLVVSGINYVEAISDNVASSMPNGIFGVAYDKPTSTTVGVIFVGMIDGFAGLVTGDALFVSTSGIPTGTAPATGTLQQIGFAVSTTEIFINILQPFRRST